MLKIAVEGPEIRIFSKGNSMPKPSLRAAIRRTLFSLPLIAAGAIAALAVSGHAGTIPSAVDGQPLPSLAPMLEKVTPAVVNINSKTRIKVRNPLLEDPFFRQFFGMQNAPRERIEQSLGSGVVIDASKGYVLTNNHVVEHASEVEVALDSGKTLPAKIIGTDKRTDLALLKISDGGNLPYVEWSNTAPRIGDWVIAVGNPFGLGGTVTAGIVSARGRDIGAGPYDDFLQIDAPVNRGNSGGPAFDERGGVIGVNTAIYSPSGGSVPA